MQQRIVGTYYVGLDQVQLVLREGQGGEFYCNPERGSVPRIKVGADHEDYAVIFEILLHEIQEFVLLKMGCRYSDDSRQSPDHGNRLFVLTHDQFQELNCRAAQLITDAINDFSAAWEEWQETMENDDVTDDAATDPDAGNAAAADATGPDAASSDDFTAGAV